MVATAVALNVGLARAFVLGYVRSARPLEWRTFGVLRAFLVAFTSSS